MTVNGYVHKKLLWLKHILIPSKLHFNAGCVHHFVILSVVRPNYIGTIQIQKPTQTFKIYWRGQNITIRRTIEFVV